MASHIPVTGLSDAYAVPGTFLEIRFGVGPSGGVGAPKSALIIGNKTSAGSGTVDTVVYGPSSNPPLRTEADVIALAGAGSEAHRMYRRFVAVNKSTPVYMVFPAASAGTAASITTAFSTVPTSTGVARYYCGDEYVDTAITTGDPLGTIATNVAASINANTSWPITAAAGVGGASGSVIATAKIAGPRGNDIRNRCLILGTPGTSCTNGTSTALSSGATADNWTNILATILPSRYYYIISPDSTVSSTLFTGLLAQVTTQALPVNGIRQLVIAGSVDTQANASTIAANSGCNNARARIVWQEASEWTAAELAAQFAASRALFDNTDPTYNFDDFGSTPQTQMYWRVPAQSQQTKWPTWGVSGSVNAAISNGLTPIAVVGNGDGTKVVMDCTTKHKNGSNYDYRSRDAHITTECDFLADDIVDMLESRFRSGKKLVADPPKGSILQDPSQVSPRIIKAGLFQKLDEHDGKGRLKNLATIKAGTDVVIDGTVQTRASCYIPVQVVNLCHQITVLLDDVSSSTY